MSALLVIGIILIGVPLYTTATESLYDIGLTKGREIALEKWRVFKECSNMDGFLKAVKEAALGAIASIGQGESASDPSEYGRGFITGLNGEMSKIAGQCTTKCAAVGKVSGEIAAAVYCEISVARGGSTIFIGMPFSVTSQCSGLYTSNCEKAFLEAPDLKESTCSKFTQDKDALKKYYGAASPSSPKGGVCTYDTTKNDTNSVDVSNEVESDTHDEDDEGDVDTKVTEAVKNSQLTTYAISELEQGTKENLEAGRPIPVCCFDTNQSVLNNNNKDYVTIAALLNALDTRNKDGNKSDTIVIVGHADERATDMFNVNLGIDRAKTVASVICKHRPEFCGNPIRPVIMSCGKINASGDTSEQQRRVDVYFPGQAMLDSKTLCVTKQQSPSIIEFTTE